MVGIGELVVRAGQRCPRLTSLHHSLHRSSTSLATPTSSSLYYTLPQQRVPLIRLKEETVSQYDEIRADQCKNISARDHKEKGKYLCHIKGTAAAFGIHCPKNTLKPCLSQLCRVNASVYMYCTVYLYICIVLYICIYVLYCISGF